MNERTFKDLKAKAERARTARDQAHGGWTAAMRRLKQDFDVDTIEEAEDLLKEMQQEAAVAEAAATTAISVFEKAWPEDDAN
jgi:hypothetical protein